MLSKLMEMPCSIWGVTDPYTHVLGSYVSTDRLSKVNSFINSVVAVTYRTFVF